MHHNWRAEGCLQPCWFQIRGVQQTGMQTRQPWAKNMPIINTSYCRVEILTLHFEIFGSFYQASSLYTAPNVQVQTASLGWWFYGQLMPRTYARLVQKKKWKKCRCIVNHCCKNTVTSSTDMIIIWLLAMKSIWKEWDMIYKPWFEIREPKHHNRIPKLHMLHQYITGVWFSQYISPH